MAVTTEVKMPGTPPRWFNSVMRGLLRTPGLRSWLGKAFAVITVTGAKTGRRYSTPVQYLEHGDDFVVTSQQMRTWWRNIRARPEVELLVRGTTVAGHATIADEATARAVVTESFDANPKVAKFYKIPVDEDGAVDRDALEQFLGGVVVILITPDS